MKTIHLLNSGLFYLMSFLYGLFLLAYGLKGLMLGLMLQTFLGISQIIFSLVLLFKINSIPKHLRRLLFGYYIITTITLVLVFSKTIIDSEILLVLIPMSIAGYFVYITNQLKTIKS